MLQSHSLNKAPTQRPVDRLNNIDLARVRETLEKAKVDRSAVRRRVSMVGSWNLGEGPQFRVNIKFEGGEQELLIDLPTFMGGGGRAPSPLHICLAGLISCFAGTIASVAAERGVRLRRLEVGADVQYDFSKTFGIEDRPIVESFEFIVKIDRC